MQIFLHWLFFFKEAGQSNWIIHGTSEEVGKKGLVTLLCNQSTSSKSCFFCLFVLISKRQFDPCCNSVVKHWENFRCSYIALGQVCGLIFIWGMRKLVPDGIPKNLFPIPLKTRPQGSVEISWSFVSPSYIQTAETKHRIQARLYGFPSKQACLIELHQSWLDWHRKRHHGRTLACSPNFMSRKSYNYS